MPTNWMNDSTRVLCAFEHASLLVGTMVLVSEDAPVCCCPRAFSQKDQLGEKGARFLLSQTSAFENSTAALDLL